MLSKYGGNKLDGNILGQLQSLGHLVEDTGNQCPPTDTHCRLRTARAALPQVMSAAQLTLESITKDPHMAKMEEVRKLRDLFARMESSLARDQERDSVHEWSGLESEREDSTLKLSSPST